MLYISHLLPDEEMSCLLEQYHIGVESIEFSIGYCLDEWESRAAAYRRRLEAMGCEGELSVHGPFLDLNPVSWDSKSARTAEERFSEAYGAAYMLKARKIIYHTCFVPMTNLLEGWAQRMIEFWNRFMKDKGTEITVCLENVFDPEYGPLREIAENISHPAFGLCLDVGHANWASVHPAEEWLKCLHPYIRHLHLHDNHGSRDEHLGLGQGSIPWNAVLPFLREELREVDITLENSTMQGVRASMERLHYFGWKTD